MLTSLRILAASALLAGSVAVVVGPAHAAPVIDGLAIKQAASDITEVRWGRGWGWGGPFVAGALIGGALAAPYGYYGPGPYYYGAGPGYGPGPRVYEEEAAGPDDSYCAQRFRSYDPGSGTYLGRDGHRHPCP